MTDKTPGHATLAAALLAAQGEMPNAVINKTNPHFKNRYADLTAVREAAIPVFTKHGIVVSQATIYDAAGRFVLRTTLLHAATGEHMDADMPLPDAGKPQEIGAAVTYMRRYGLVAVAGLTSEEDDDGEAAAPVAARPRQAVATKGGAKASGATTPEGDALVAEVVGCDTMAKLRAWGTNKDVQAAIAALIQPEQDRVRRAYADRQNQFAVAA